MTFIASTGTHDLRLGASEVEEDHSHAVVGGHPQTLEGLLQQDALPHAQLLGEQREALVDVDPQGHLLPVPAAGWSR